MGAGVRHALVSTHSLSGDRFESHLAGFGLNRCQQLGKKGSGTPSIATNVSGKVLQIACGREHSAMVVEKKDKSKVVMVCGSNSYGQLGIGDAHRLQEAAIPKQTAELEQEEYLIPASGLVEVAALKDMLRSDEMPVRVQCGMDHTVILTSLGRVFAMGWGSDGQLGAGPDSTVCHDRPVQVFGLDKAPIVDISSSTDFTLALSADGRLFYWGNAEYGQCMIGKKIDQVLAPLEIPFTDGTIVKIAAGGCHALVLLSDGRVYGCGYGAIGMGADTASSLTPSLVKGISDIGHIAASTDRCLALDSQNNVYSWGLGNHAGRLGNGTVFSNLYAPTRLDISPKHVQPAFMALGNDIALEIHVGRPSLCIAGIMDEQVETTNKQFPRHKLFSRELALLMYGFGDSISPLPESVDVLEDILVDFINSTCVQAATVSGRKNKILVEDFKFILRKDPKKLARVEELLAMNKEIEVARTLF
ncbi:hypothetical protein H4217_002220 [Coemansia sp. RSA 1939]|nr:hypothetical protein H4217_002220 [Coemansia sp. RSA 1939]